MTISHPKEVKLNISLGKEQLHSKLKPHYSARERFASTLAAYDIYKSIKSLIHTCNIHKTSYIHAHQLLFTTRKCTLKD